MSEMEIDDAATVDGEAVAELEAVAPATVAEPAPLLELPGDQVAAPSPVLSLDPDLALVLDVPVSLVVEIGRTSMTIRETLGIGRGSIITLDKLSGEPADLLVNGRLIARGEVIAIDEEFGFRVTDVVSPERRLEAGWG